MSHLMLRTPPREAAHEGTVDLYKEVSGKLEFICSLVSRSRTNNVASTFHLLQKTGQTIWFRSYTGREYVVGLNEDDYLSIE